MSTGDITRNNVMMHSLFCDYTTLFPAALGLLLTLDCSKGYNRTGWSWIYRCLNASRLPTPLCVLILAFLRGTAHLVFRGVESAGVEFRTGLTQGCPLSCLLFILIVDPLLTRMQKVPGVLGVSGFVDDWAAFCRGMAALADLRPIVLTFARASGLVINIPKSGVLPTRLLTDAETAAIRTVQLHGETSRRSTTLEFSVCALDSTSQLKTNIR